MPAMPRPAHRRALIVAALVLVIAMQWLGAVHRVLHPAGAPHDTAHSLFAEHDQASDCQLFDDLAVGDVAVGTDVPAVGIAGADRPLAFHPGWQLAAQAAGFLARGPPARS